MPSPPQGVQRDVHSPAVPAVDRERRVSGPRHRLRRQVLRPRRPHVLHLRRPGLPAPCVVSVVVVRGVWEDGEPGERRGGAAVDGELARVPGGGGDRAPRRRAAADAGASRLGRRRRRGRGREGEPVVGGRGVGGGGHVRGVVAVLGVAAEAEALRRRRRRGGGEEDLRSRSRSPAHAGWFSGEEGRAPTAGLAVDDELRRVDDDDDDDVLGERGGGESPPPWERRREKALEPLLLKSTKP